MNPALVSIKTILNSILADLPHSTPRLADPTDQPETLLLTVSPFIAGFWMIDENQPHSAKAVDLFKQLYVQNSERWAAFDLILVLCRHGAAVLDDSTSKKIEVNPYFCRKFVIDVTKDLPRELERLPFVPLATEGTTGFKRPPSAIDYLLGHGTKLDLAKALSSPHTKSSETIISGILRDSSSPPAWKTSKPTKKQDKVLASVSPRRVTGLTLSDFRAFRGQVHFDLDADIVVLGGPNGLGKTSFFDAIDFACTGSIGRFEKRFRRDPQKWTEALRHLDRQKAQSWVDLQLTSDDSPVHLRRHLSDRANAHHGSQKIDRKSTLGKLTGLEMASSDIRVENLVNLFRASHLFGQDFVSLAPDFKSESAVSQDIVSRMLALQDYVEAIKKSQELESQLDRQLSRINTQYSTHLQEIRTKRMGLSKLRKSPGAKHPPKPPAALAEKIMRQAPNLLGVAAKRVSVLTPDAARELRASIEARIVSLTKQSKGLNAQVPKIAQLSRLKESSIELQKQFTSNQSSEKAAAKSVRELILQLDESTNAVARLTAEQSTLEERTKNLKWLLVAQKKYSGVKRALSNARGRLTKLSSKSKDISKRIENTNARLAETKSSISSIGSDLLAAQQSLEALASVEVSMLGRESRRFAKLKKSIDRSKRNLGRLDGKMAREHKRILNTQKELSRARKDVSTLEKAETELATLMQRLVGYATDSHCPACGKKHESRKDLISRLRSRQGPQSDQLKVARASLSSKAKALSKQEELVGSSRTRAAILRDQLKQQEEELAGLNRLFAGISSTAVELGIHEDSVLSKAHWNSKRSQLKKRVSHLKRDLWKLKLSKHKLSQTLNDFDKQASGIRSLISSADQSISKSQNTVDGLLLGAKERNLSMQIQPDSAGKTLAEAKTHSNELSRTLKAERGQITRIRKKINIVAKIRAASRRKITHIENRQAKTNISMAHIRASLKQHGLHAGAKQETIAKKNSALVELKSTMRDLVAAVIEWEVAHDLSQRSANIASLAKDLDGLKEELGKLKKNRDCLEEWRSYVSRLGKSLKDSQSKTLREYIAEYAPLATCIQGRLRSVYGFGELRLVPEKRAITVQVNHPAHSGAKNPGDYFSESELQIVVLSLFLSATLTQTWSSFAPILFDDPVQHFDDMNAYSFIDLVSGMLLQTENRKQFIISTCEDRFFELMRQKFKKLGRKAIYYRFLSIGRDGPVIERQ